MMSYLVLALMGLIAGAIAKFIFPGKDPGGIFVTMIIGVCGAFVGNTVRTLVGSGDGKISFTSPLDWAFAIGGSVLILFIWKKFLGPMFGGDTEK